MTPAAPAASAAAGIRVIDPRQTPDWDEQVLRLPGAGFFHSAPWCRVLTETYGYTPRYLARFRDQTMEALLPLLEVDSWLTGRRGVALPFTDLAPPLCPDAAAFAELHHAARSLALERKMKYLELRGGSEWLPDAPPSTSFYQHVLPLSADEKTLFSGCDDSVRRAIRKAEKNSLTLVSSRDEAAMRAFYDLMCLTRQRHGVPPQPYRFFANIQRHVMQPGHGTIVLARQGTRLVAGAVYFQFGREVIYKFGASDERLQQLRANNLVMWHAIRTYAQAGCTSLDFGRTSLGNEGLRRFKLSWGTQEHLRTYTRYDFRLGRYVTASDDSTGWHTRVFNKLPIPLARAVGLVLYPHMG